MYKKESKKNIREDLVRVWNYSHELQRDGVMPVGTFHKHTKYCSKYMTITKKWYNSVLKTRNTNRFFYIIRQAIPFIDNKDKITISKTVSSTVHSQFTDMF